jgi:hypothetical protein
MEDLIPSQSQLSNFTKEEALNRDLFSCLMGIDTARIKIPFSYKLWADVEPSCRKTTTQDNLSSVQNDPSLSGSIIIPPFDQELSIFSYNYQIYLEGSFSRLWFGSNTRPLPLRLIPEVLKKIHHAAVDKYGAFPSWETWEFQRVDFSCDKKFRSAEEASRVLDFLTSLNYPRKSIHIHPNESVTFLGRTSSIKCYLKNLEYGKKGYHELFKKNFYALADEADKLSEDVVRIELEIRKQKLKTLYNKQVITYKDLINEGIFLDFFNETLDVLLRSSNRVSINDAEAINQLIETYGSQKGLRLFNFWETYYSRKRHIKGLLKRHSNATTILKNLKELSAAGVGFPDDDSPLPFDLSIPRRDVVTEPIPSALAEGLVNNKTIAIEKVDDVKEKQLDFKESLE